jgi:AcrR family transcriptional regulator
MPQAQPASTSRPRPGQAITRKHVLGTVYDLISEHGIENLSMRQVAQAAGLSTGTITYHFGSKERLLIAALENAYELPADWEEYRGSPAAQLRRLLMGYVCRPGGDRFWRFWINYLATSTRDSEMLAHQQQRYERRGRFWAQLIRDGIAAGEFSDQHDPDLKADELLVLAHGLLIQQLIDPGRKIREKATDVLNGFLGDLGRGSVKSRG